MYSGCYHAPCPVGRPLGACQPSNDHASVETVLIDFHTHTTASDGALTPREIIDRALTRHIALLAITDHDTVAGYRAAAAYYTPNPGGLRLVHPPLEVEP